MLVKILVILALLAILYNLGSGLYYLIKDEGHSSRTLKALSWRIGLSLALFILLMLGFLFGVINPHGI